MAARLSGRATYDLDPQLKQRITSLAKSYSIPASQLAQVLLLGGLALVENGALDIPSLRKLSRSPRYDFVLDLENLEISR